MRKKEYIQRYGQRKYTEMLKGRKQKSYPEKNKEWRAANPEITKFHHNNANRKGGAHYEQRLRQNREGLQGDRGRVRRIDGNHFRKYKKFFAQKSQLHHQWVPGTAEYTGLALVEQDRHMHGYIDVFLILGGEITIFDEHLGARGNV